MPNDQHRLYHQGSMSTQHQQPKTDPIRIEAEKSWGSGEIPPKSNDAKNRDDALNCSQISTPIFQPTASESNFCTNSSITHTPTGQNKKSNLRIEGDSWSTGISVTTAKKQNHHHQQQRSPTAEKNNRVEGGIGSNPNLRHSQLRLEESSWTAEPVSVSPASRMNHQDHQARPFEPVHRGTRLLIASSINGANESFL